MNPPGEQSSGMDIELLRQKVNQLTTLISLNTVMSAKTDLHSVLRLVGVAARNAVSAQASALLLVDPKTRELYFEVAEGEKSRQVREVRVPIGQGIAGWVAEHGQPQIVNDPYKDPRFFPDADKRSGFTTRNLLCVPIRLKHQEPTTSEHIVGVLEVVNKEGESPFTQEDQDVVELVGNQAAVAIENARLVKSLRAALDRLQSLHTSLVYSEKLSFLGQLSTGIVRDLQNPLSEVLGQVSKVKSQAPSELSAELEKAERQLTNMQSIVSSLLTYTQHTGDVTTFQLEPVIDNAIALIRHLPHAHHLAITREGDPLPTMEGHPHELQQVLVNLLSNAVDATPDDGKTRPITVRHRCDATRSHITLEVRDHGTGITKEHHHKLFMPFFSTKSEGQGTGMGLAVVQAIIARHKGTVHVRSEPPEGTTFTITLPTNPKAVSAMEPGTRRILVADDDPLHVKIVSDFLREHGFEVQSAANGREALAYVETRPNDLCLCLLDMLMPEMDGLATIQGLLQLRSDLPVFIVTSLPNAPEVSRALQRGASEVLVKPLTPDYMLNRVLVRIEAALG